MTNFERIKKLTIEGMAEEIKLIANWDRKEKKKAEKDEKFYEKWLDTENTMDDKCKRMNSDYCKNECPLGKNNVEV